MHRYTLLHPLPADWRTVCRKLIDSGDWWAFIADDRLVRFEREAFRDWWGIIDLPERSAWLVEQLGQDSQYGPAVRRLAEQPRPVTERVPHYRAPGTPNPVGYEGPGMDRPR